MNANRLFAVFAQLSEAPDAMLQLRRFVLDLAVRGELVPPDVETEAIAAAPRIVRTEMTRSSELTEARPYLVPPAWNWQSIEEVAVQVSDGEHATPARIVDHQVPLVTAKNVRDGKMVYDQTDWVSHETAVKAWGRCRPIPGDILLVCVGATIGRLCVLREKRDMVLVRSVALIRPSPRVDADFLALALRSPAGQAEMWRRAKVAAQPCLYLNRIRTLCIPVPPLSEQRRIVARVNELMAVCDELKAAQDQRERRRKRLSAASLARLTAAGDTPGRVAEKDAAFFLSHLSCMVTKAEHVADLRRTILDLAVQGCLTKTDHSTEKRLTLKDACLLIVDGDHNPPPRVQAGIPYVTARNVTDRGLELMSASRVSASEWTSDRVRYRPEENDVLITCVGTLGRTSIVGVDKEFLIDRNVAALRPNKGVLARYLQVALDAPSTQKFLVSASGSTAQPHIYLKDLRRTEVRIPCRDEQARIAAKVDALMEMCDELEASLEAVESGRAGVLAAVLRGVLEESEAPFVCVAGDYRRVDA